MQNNQPHPALELASLRIFAKVAELASFTRAAQQLGLPKASVSTGVQQLELQLGTRLLHRTTRTVRLSADGEQFLERCRQLLGEADELQAMFQQSPSALRGRLRVDLPTKLARQVLIPRLPEFIAAHPLLEIELSATDRRVDLVHEGFDCVLRIGRLDDSGLVARRLGELPMANIASVGYIAAHGMPRTLEDLDHHRIVRYVSSLGAGGGDWEYRDGDSWRLRPMRSVLAVTNTDAYEAACLAGLGLIQAPRIGLAAMNAQVPMQEVLPEFTAEPMPVWLVYPHRRHLAKRVQAWMDWLVEVLAPHLATAARDDGTMSRAAPPGRANRTEPT